jgi:hypothetical protein
MNPGAVEEGAKVAGGAIEAMKSIPLAIALLAVNVMWLGGSGYLLLIQEGYAAERDKAESALVAQLVRDCRDGRLTPPTQEK